MIFVFFYLRDLMCTKTVGTPLIRFIPKDTTLVVANVANVQITCFCCNLFYYNNTIFTQIGTAILVVCNFTVNRF